MALFVGLDVSLKTVSICILKADGTVVWEGKALSEPASLIKALARRRKNIQVIGIEACPLSEWLYGALVDSGFTTMCIETRHAQLLRTTLIARRTFVGHMLAIEQTIRGLLRVYGLKLGQVHRCTFAAKSKPSSRTNQSYGLRSSPFSKLAMSCAGSTWFSTGISRRSPARMRFAGD